MLLNVHAFSSPPTLSLACTQTHTSIRQCSEGARTERSLGIPLMHTDLPLNRVHVCVFFSECVHVHASV